MLSLIAEFLAVFGQPMLELANIARLHGEVLLTKARLHRNANSLAEKSDLLTANDNPRQSASDRSAA